MIHPNDEALQDIPGVCGIVDGSVMAGYYGIEAGQSRVGDIFLWFVNTLVPEKFGRPRTNSLRIWKSLCCFETRRKRVDCTRLE